MRSLFLLLLCWLGSARGELASPHGAMNLECAGCHSTAGWVLRQDASFNHDVDTDWPLEGVHQAVACASCHLDLGFRGTGRACADCHLDLHQGGLGDECRDCHSPERWIDRAQQERRHDRSLFPLTGAHRGLSCTRCHEGTGAAQFAAAPLECAACHTGDYLSARSPDHVAGGLTGACSTCHGTARWSDDGPFQHDQFPLMGAHEGASCASCHAGSRFAGTSTTCSDCHLTSWQSAVNPVHSSAGFSQNCASCHDEHGWRPSSFSHAGATGYELSGAHAAVACSQCHAGGQYQDTSPVCSSCHLPAFQATTEPAHQALGYPEDCAICHTTSAWQDSDFDHQATGFPLEQAHLAVHCSDCHLGGNFSTTPTDCYSCHQANFAGTTDPAHESGLFPQDCRGCHNQTDWGQFTLDHQATEFPLNGAHGAVTCADCHVNGIFVGNATDCWSCHEQHFVESTDPPHGADEFPRDCTLCHGDAGWTPSTLDHDLTQFPLAGAHEVVRCADCHVNGLFAGNATDCWSCHEQDFVESTEPPHGVDEFPQDCTLCHGDAGWTPSTLDHDLTRFPLTGAHVMVRCADCHVSGQFIDLPGTCWDCHEPEYQQAADPDHAANQFSQDCTMCHSTAVWQPSTFDHALSDFPLTGAHVTTSCAACHVNGLYDGTPTDCWSCHQDDYDGANDPDHVAAQFPHDCAVCHTTNDWEGAEYNHDETDFPLTGAHIVVNCALCHINGQYENTPTDCFFCHDSDFQQAANPDHAGEGYPTDCAFCHDTAAGWASSFNHASFFPIYTGRHRDEWQTCASCHLGNELSDFSCTHCHEHRQSAMDDDHSEVANYVWESHACLDCHPDGSSLRGPDLRWKGMDLRPKESLR